METLHLAIEPPVATVVLSRPAVLNAIDQSLLGELDDALQNLESVPELRVVILTGAGEKAFSAGGDIARMAEMAPADGLQYRIKAHRMLERIERSRLIYIAAINGHALGGGLELALACDVRIVADEAKLGLPELTVGLIPGWGGMQRLVRTVGVSLTKDMVFASRRISGADAVQHGLASRVVPRSSVLSEAQSVARAIGAASPIALVQAKKALNEGREMTLHHALAYDIECAQINFSSQDRVEGLRAYLEKRIPQYQNR